MAKVVKYDTILYKAKLVLKSTNPDLIQDPEAVNLIYIQATADVVTERYPCNEKDLTVLAALQLQATFGDYKKDQHVPGWLKPKIAEFMPSRLLEKKPGKQSDTLVAEWEQKILSKYMKVSGFTALEAKLNYLDYVQEWVFYGSTFFTVEQRQFKDYPSPLTLGINTEGCLLMHPEKKTVLGQTRTDREGRGGRCASALLRFGVLTFLFISLLVSFSPFPSARRELRVHRHRDVGPLGREVHRRRRQHRPAAQVDLQDRRREDDEPTHTRIRKGQNAHRPGRDQRCCCCSGTDCPGLALTRLSRLRSLLLLLQLKVKNKETGATQAVSSPSLF